MSFSRMRKYELCTLTLISLMQIASANLRSNQRIYVQAKAISFVDATKHGFRIILHDSFMKKQLAANLLPMLYISAIPLKRGLQPVTKMIYPDTIYDDKQVNIGELGEKSWYSVCVEWENFSRHNETVGVDCGLYRTLDKMGQSADSTIDDIAVPDTDSQAVLYRLKTQADFPIRITLTLRGGVVMPPAQNFYVTEPSMELEGSFQNLRQFTNYGKLCVLEEPAVTGYTAMGRLISGLNIQKCYFSDITTKDYELSTFDPEASAYRTSAANLSSKQLAFIVLFLLSVFCRR